MTPAEVAAAREARVNALATVYEDADGRLKAKGPACWCCGRRERIPGKNTCAQCALNAKNAREAGRRARKKKTS